MTPIDYINQLLKSIDFTEEEIVDFSSIIYDSVQKIKDVESQMANRVNLKYMEALTLISSIFGGDLDNLVRNWNYGYPTNVYNYPDAPVELNHIFTLSGTDLVATIEANTIPHKASTKNLGISIYKTDIASNTSSSSIFNTSTGLYQFSGPCERLTKGLNITNSRTYWINEVGNVTTRLDYAHQICEKFNIDPATYVICLDKPQPQSALGDSALPTSLYEEAVTYNLAQNYGFKMWEIGNEPFYCWGVYSTESVYADYVIATSIAIKAIDSTALIGISPMRKGTNWGNTCLTLAAGYYDFVSPHWYGWANLDNVTTDAAVLSENYRTIDYQSYLNNTIKTLNPNKEVYQFDTEWRLFPSTATTTGENDRHCGNIVGAMHLAVRMIYTVRDGYLRGSSSWSLNGGSPGSTVPAGNYIKDSVTYPADGTSTPVYWTKYYFTRYIHENIVSFTGTSPSHTGTVARYVDEGSGPLTVEITGPKTPMICTMNSDKTKMGIVIVNGADSTTPFDLEINDFIPINIEAKSITQTTIDDFQIIDYQTDIVSNLVVDYASKHLTGTLAAYSINFIELSKQSVPVKVDETYKISFGTSDYAVDHWNAFKQLTAGYGFDVLETTTGNINVIGVKLVDAWLTTNNGGMTNTIYPDEISVNSFYTSDDIVRDILVYNLDQTRQYSFTFFGSRNTTGSRIAQYTIGATTVELEAIQNTSNTVTISEVTPDSNGQVTISVNRKAGSTYGYLNAIIIETLA
jgi:hypothetical protein